MYYSPRTINVNISDIYTRILYIYKYIKFPKIIIHIAIIYKNCFKNVCDFEMLLFDLNNTHGLK